MSAHYDLGEHSKYYRVFYMDDGNFLVTGGPERYGAFMQILDKSATKPPTRMDVQVIEGPAVSRLTFPIKFAYCPEGQDKIRIASLTYDEAGNPILKNDHLVLDGHKVPAEEGVNYIGMIESQNWRPPEEKELIFSRYAQQEGF